ncbi:MAG TPA: hypothetical protein ENJ10_05160 [Caldithrix abyssi]|uniref:Uncharacterized protein n=1 Tax=Caldithrix abyssi TaxID=187145 RepID=A0A7V1LLC0_CALAY|nr:hypothetical protein [Caldithrix abyssi]
MPYFDDDGNELDPNLIPVPGLCLICKKNNDPGEEILCTLTRLDQKEGEEFICHAFEEEENTNGF